MYKYICILVRTSEFMMVQPNLLLRRTSTSVFLGKEEGQKSTHRDSSSKSTLFIKI